MHMQGSCTEVLRFEIPVNGEAYRSLVAGLRGSGQATLSRALRSGVRAQVDFDLNTRCFSVSTLGSHRLPSAISVKPGSATHNSIARLISRSVRDQEHTTVASLMRDIIDAAPTISDEILSIRKQDIEVRIGARAAAAISPLHSIQLLAEAAPTISLDLDDAPTLIIPESQDALLAFATERLKAELSVLEQLNTTVVENTVTLRATIRIPAISEVAIDLFAHWGAYDDLAPAWQDEQLTLQPGPGGTATVEHRLHVQTRGDYGVTLFAQVRGSHEQVWIGRPGSGDSRFFVSQDDLHQAQERESDLDSLDAWCVETIRHALSYGTDLEDACEEIIAKVPHAPLGELLARVAPSLPVRALSSAQFHAPLAASMQLNYGIGEVVFATPEGPHAAAGGLAQVISGLPPELSREGIPVTIIAPLYRHANGNKHSDAQHILSHGVKLGDATVLPRYAGSVTVNLGPTYHSGTTSCRRAPSAVPVKVYEAAHKNMRLFLLANTSVFDRLYQPVFADEQLRRAIVFSRAVLETVAAKHLGIRPSVLISNDWMTACIPAFAALDPAYQSVPWLRECKTLHMIHNGGADYHGRLPNNISHEDLWPMLNLAPEHFFGFRDPHSWSLLNFSMAAAHHAHGILTVSEPYAQQLLAHCGGDGLEHVLRHKRELVFGISNGINRPEVSRYLSLIAGKGGEQFTSLDELLEAKKLTKSRIQERYGLTPSPNARLASFVGRMAEQKGLSLLSGFVAGSNLSTLEELLVKHPDLQILVAGPMTEGDESSRGLRGTLEYLRALYPGRVSAVFDYVTHSTALEIMFGSTFFLMPSRFEPGGITQLEAMACGTLVIGRNVGGISSTIDNFCGSSATGNGFLCNDYTPTAFANTCHWALQETQSPGTYRALVRNALEARHNWSDRVPNYRSMLQALLGCSSPNGAPVQ